MRVHGARGENEKRPKNSQIQKVRSSLMSSCACAQRRNSYRCRSMCFRFSGCMCVRRVSVSACSRPCECVERRTCSHLPLMDFSWKLWTKIEGTHIRWYATTTHSLPIWIQGRKTMWGKSPDWPFARKGIKVIWSRLLQLHSMQGLCKARMCWPNVFKFCFMSLCSRRKWHRNEHNGISRNCSIL